MKEDMTLFEKLQMVNFLINMKERKPLAGGSPLHDRSRGQGRILALLKMKDGVSTKEIANVLGIRTSSLNETLNRLEKSGYIKRERSPDDGRIMLVYLTDKGREEEQPEASPIKAFDVLSETEQEELGSYLDKIIEGLEGELSEREREWIKHFFEDRDAAFERFFDGEHHGPRGFARGGFAHFGGFHCKMQKQDNSSCDPHQWEVNY